MRRKDTKVDRLGEVKLFRACSARELGHIGSIADEVVLAPGTQLCVQGRTGLECFIIVNGEADVFVDGQLVATSGPGQTVGEMALLDGDSQSATVVARTPMEVYVIERRRFQGLLGENPGVAMALLKEMSFRVRDLDARQAEAVASAN